MADFDNFPRRRPYATALALSLAAAIALGTARFSYGLLLPPMREDLGWSFLLAGAMNTGNALGYLLGALTTPALLRRFAAHRLLVAGAALTSVFMLLPGIATDTDLLLLLRLLAGISSAYVFIAGGVLAARLGAMHAPRAGLLLGIYYGGTGFGIVMSALLVPATLAASHASEAAHGWQWCWLALGMLCLAATAIMTWPARQIPESAPAAGTQQGFRVKPFAFGLSGYFMFGIGYIGYMTFVVALLRQQGLAPTTITVFYTLLGLAVLTSSRIWAGVLDRFKGGEPLAIMSGVLGVATVLPALTTSVWLAYLSGLMFGAVFLSVVASTTALVRHNLPAHAWSAGISAFTTVFAFGQIIGPTIVGWIADGQGGLERGLVFSAAAIFVGAVLASRQPALERVAPGEICHSK